MLLHVVEYSGMVIPTYEVLRLLVFVAALWLGVSLTERADIRRDIPMHFGLFTLLVGVASPKFYLFLRVRDLSHVLCVGGGVYYGLTLGILLALWYMLLVRMGTLIHGASTTLRG